jgi:hypothetical protein
MQKSRLYADVYALVQFIHAMKISRKKKNRQTCTSMKIKIIQLLTLWEEIGDDLIDFTKVCG